MVLLELAVTELDFACPAGAEPMEYEGLRQRYLQKVTIRSRVENRNSQHALYPAACMHGGLQLDLLSDAGWWQTPRVTGIEPSWPAGMLVRGCQRGRAIKVVQDREAQAAIR